MASKQRNLTLILADNRRQAERCARNLGLRHREWRYMMTPLDVMGYSPGEHIRVVAYSYAPNSMRLAARERGFEVEDYHEPD